MTEVVPGTLALRRGWRKGGASFCQRRPGHSFLSSAAGAFSFQRGRGILSFAAGVIFLSAWPVHPFICGTGASADQTAAAVGRQNACPSGAVLQPFRGRRQFEYAVRHTFPAKSRPLEAILYVHRPRSRKYLAFASGTALPPLHKNASPWPPKIPCLRFTNCLSFTLRNFRSAKANLFCQWRRGILVICGEVILSSAGAVHPFISGTGASAEQTAAAVGRQNACPSGAVLQPYRGRRHFEYAVRHTFPAKSRPVEAILYVHRPRSRAAMPSSPGMPCLRFTNCLVFVSGNVLPSLHEISAQQRQISRQWRRGILVICDGSHFLFSVAGAFFHLQPEHSLVIEGGASFHLRYRSIC